MVRQCIPSHLLKIRKCLSESSCLLKPFFFFLSFPMQSYTEQIIFIFSNMDLFMTSLCLLFLWQCFLEGKHLSSPCACLYAACMDSHSNPSAFTVPTEYTKLFISAVLAVLFYPFPVCIHLFGPQVTVIFYHIVSKSLGMKIGFKR